MPRPFSGSERLVRLSIDQVIENNQVDRSGGTYVVDARRERSGAKRDSHPGDDCLFIRHADERESCRVSPGRSREGSETRTVLRKELNRRLVRQIDIAQDDSKPRTVAGVGCPATWNS